MLVSALYGLPAPPSTMRPSIATSNCRWVPRPAAGADNNGVDATFAVTAEYPADCMDAANGVPNLIVAIVAIPPMTADSEKLVKSRNLGVVGCDFLASRRGNAPD